MYNKMYISTFKIDSLFLNGFNNYDPNKPNIIFLDSPLFQPLTLDEKLPRIMNMPIILNEIKSTVSELLSKYNLNEYNLMFKLHPAFTEENALLYVKTISSEKNFIILNPTIPIETMISYDYINYINQDTSYFFKQNNKIKPWE